MRQGALKGDSDALKGDGKALKGNAEGLNGRALRGACSKLLFYVTFRH